MKEEKDINANQESSQCESQPTQIQSESREGAYDASQSYQKNNSNAIFNQNTDSVVQPQPLQKAKRRRRHGRSNSKVNPREFYRSDDPEGNSFKKLLNLNGEQLVENCVKLVENVVIEKDGPGNEGNHIQNTLKRPQKSNAARQHSNNIATNQVSVQQTRIRPEFKDEKSDGIQECQSNLHPRYPSIQSHQKVDTSKKKGFLPNCKMPPCEFAHSEDPQSCEYFRSQSFKNDRPTRTQKVNTPHHQINVAKGNRKNIPTVQGNNQAVQIQSEWEVEESNAIQQHRSIIGDIKDRIQEIILSEDYSTNYEKHEANIRILRGTITELESHIFIFDSIKSRTCRELSSKPRELCNQIFREIYRLKCRLGAYAKRLDMEKYFTSGHRFLIVQGQTGSGFYVYE